MINLRAIKSQRAIYLTLAFCLFCLSISVANAATSGNKLVEYCRFYPSKTEASSFCMGYIMGVLDDIRVVGEANGNKYFCQPPSVTGEQLMSVAIKYMNDNPESLNYTASSLIVLAYMKAFPCL